MRNNKMFIKGLLLIASCLLVVNFMAAAVKADIPDKINIQGILHPRPEEGEMLNIGIWDDPTGGNKLTDISKEIVYANPSALQVEIDESGFFNLAVPAPNIPFDKPYYMQFKLLNSNITFPRQPLLSDPYAITAKNVYGGTGYFDGNVGIGTAEPSMSLDVVKTSLWNRPAIGGTYGDKWAYLHVSSIHSLIWDNSTSMRFGIEASKGSTYTEHMRIEPDGKVGIGKTNPIARLDVYDFGPAIRATSANYNGVHAETTNGNAAVWAVAGSNATYGGSFLNSKSTGTAVRGRCTSNTGKNYAIYGRVDSSSGYAGYFYGGRNYFSGKVGIGDDTPTTQLDVARSNGTAIRGRCTSGIGLGVEGNSTYIGVLGSGNVWDFWASNGKYGNMSSIRWKRNVNTVDNALDKVLKLRGVYFDWDEDHGGEHAIGMIAEEVGKVLPEIVEYEKDGSGYTTGMDYTKVVPVLVEAIKEQQKEIESLKKEIAELKR